ncbi:serine/threonine protein kinase, partial [Candidatus Sumerlaeota bacterium]|nr:serine/threonine protein kinase [Candidatus Sumerlaeota bacterium]
IGRGGMGVVFEADQISQPRKIALKIPQDEVSSDANYIRRFYDEARIAIKLRHRNIVATYEVGQADGRHFIAMEYVEGRPLSMIIKKEAKLDAKSALKYARHAASGLVILGKEDVVHRDIKPKNIIVENSSDVAKIMDFGIARIRRRGMDQTQDSQYDWIGTKYYLAPEQCLGKRADHRSDVYALGVALFEMLAGRVPFESNNPLELVKMIIEAPVPEIQAFNPLVPADVQTILDMALAKDPADRYSSAAEMEDDLGQLIARMGSSPKIA